MLIHSTPSRRKPIAHRLAVGGASANLDRGPATQRLPMAAVVLTVEPPLRRTIARVQPTEVGVHTGRVLRTAVAMAATAEAQHRPAIAPGPSTSGARVNRLVPRSSSA